ncbi:hypothetical protein AMS68_007542 [Peltaster fructicola]|uniref:FAM192A/Fyv6 N-terminal domain-containing protein n=1 Tax=Peltaster fructicola TaxID=286661 RepID=A0A6H0Y541_9PEZI|nr:hypothetical protein AMS68_007542 [Peltaster fructicola]
MSRFVSGGTDEEPAERDDAWIQAQKAVEARHLAKLDAGKQDGGKSLFETLQANKDAKQAAFEESIRLRNQFRSLDDDEVEFLDSIAAESRAKEAEVRRDAKLQLDAFRAQQEEAEQASKQSTDVVPDAAEAWTAGGRKRKKQATTIAGIVKKRQLSSSKATPGADKADSFSGKMLSKESDATTDENKAVIVASTVSSTSATSDQRPAAMINLAVSSAAASLEQKPSLGLADYSSDEG